MMQIRGELWGQRSGIAGAKNAGDVVRIVQHHRDGPAENAWIFVEQTPDARKAATSRGSIITTSSSRTATRPAYGTPSSLRPLMRRTPSGIRTDGEASACRN